MRPVFKNTEVEIREIRNNSIVAYYGTAKELSRASENNELKCCENTFNQCSDCSAQRAFLQVGLIQDAAVVNHAPIGCAADFSLFQAQKRNGLPRRGQKALDLYAINTNMQEKDTIYGATRKLKNAIFEAYERFHPKVIFITTSCASGIIGEDIESVADETEAQLGIPVIPIYCEGFKSKIWTTGSDAVYHAVVKKLVKPPKKKQMDTINIFNFSDGDAYGPFLAKFGLKVKYFLPLSTVADIETMAESAATGHICETLATYIARGLEEEYGVPEIKSPPPYGIDWTDRWIREVGKITGREELVERVIKEEKERIAPRLEELRKELAGKTVYITTGSSFGHGLASIVTDLGMKVIGQASIHHHQKLDTEEEWANSLNNIIQKCGDIENYMVCTKQPYQVINMLKKLHPDLLIIRHDTFGEIGAKLGIPTYFANDANISMGYDGVISLGEFLLKALSRKHFWKNVADHCKLPYTEWWYEQDVSFFQGEK